MKYFITFVFIIIALSKTDAQEKFERFTINLELTHPIFNKLFSDNIDTGIEALMNSRIFNNKILSTGISLQHGKHIRKERVAYLVKVEGKLYPYKGTNYWNLNFLSVEAPLYFIAPFNKLFLDSYRAGIDFGWLWKYNLTEESMPNIPNIKINRLYLKYNLGIQKNLYQAKKISIMLLPTIGYKMYLSNHNNWQKDYIFYQLNFNFNF